jgi:hypothetical protein
MHVLQCFFVFFFRINLTSITERRGTVRGEANILEEHSQQRESSIVDL